ncbi:Uncharacterised protein [Legionella maceachernii]|nr:Uncharacterised protein [Legionella maceachernii]
MGENTLVDDEIKELQLIINSQQLELKKKLKSFKRSELN